MPDRELYLTEAWTRDEARLQAVRLAPDTPFATKPVLAQCILARVLEDAGVHHALAVPRNELLWVGRDIWTPEAVHAIHAGGEWYRLSACAGNKGERWYDWQCWVLAEPEGADWGCYLPFRRSLADPDAWQAYVAFAPQGCDLERLVAVAGHRWCIEHAFEAAKQEVGLDDYEVRSADDWYRHVTLALLAVVRAADLPRPDPKKESATGQPDGFPAGARPSRGLRDPALPVAPVAAGADHRPDDPGQVALVSPSPVDGAGLPLPSATIAA